MSHEPVVRLEERHRRMVPLVAAGATRRVIAAELGLSLDQVARVLRHPEFQAAVAALRAESQQVFQQALQAEIARDGLRNLKFLKAVRAGNVDGKPEQLRVRVQAATALLDRQLPKRTEVQEERTVRIQITAEDRRAMEAVVAEVAALPAPGGAP